MSLEILLERSRADGPMSLETVYHACSRRSSPSSSPHLAGTQIAHTLGGTKVQVVFEVMLWTVN
jgi:hypothetical protein